jgi:3-hydroxyisobutyrate dehydrogenase-like beta-hydroxyacid dehydrogenase
MTDVGFIGLGSMGSVMARRLMAAGHTVHVWNRTSSAAEELVAAGAVLARSPEAAIATGIVFSMLANDAAVESVFSTEALAAAPDGGCHVIHSTISVAAADRLAELHEAAGIDYIAAPVLGRPNVAAAGDLNIVAAGDPAAIERVQPFLDVLGRRTWVVGATPSAANLVKIGVNYNLIHALQALGESLTLVERGGVDGETFVEILTDVAFTGSAYTGYGSAIARKAYTPPGFTVALGLKDLSLTEAAAASLGVTLPTSPVLRSMFESALANPELAELDWAAIAEITRGLALPE